MGKRVSTQLSGFNEGITIMWFSFLFMSLLLNWFVELGSKQTTHSILNAHGICGTFFSYKQ